MGSALSYLDTTSDAFVGILIAAQCLDVNRVMNSTSFLDTFNTHIITSSARRVGRPRPRPLFSERCCVRSEFWDNLPTHDSFVHLGMPLLLPRKSLPPSCPLAALLLDHPRAPVPIVLDELAHAALARDGQLPLLEDLLDDLPPAHPLGLVDGRPPPPRDLDVGQRRQLARLLDRVVDLAGRRRLDDEGEQLADVVSADEPGVGDAVARELVDSLGDLWNSAPIVVVSST